MKECKLPLTSLQIREILPHRYPFLLVDRVVALESGTSIQAFKNLSVNEAFFSGHFPAMPIMPGVMQVEALAQAAGILMYFADEFDPKRHIGFLAGIDAAKFRRPVVPGDRLLLDVELISKRLGVAKFRGKSSVDGEKAAEATLVLVIKEQALA